MKYNNKICVLGLGYVGLTLSVTLASLGFDVFGVEIRKKVINDLKKKKSHFYEPGLLKTLKKVIKNKKFQFFDKIPKKWNGDTFIITVGTPLDSKGNSRMDLIENVSREVSVFLKKNDLVILRSTVKIGTSRNIVAKILKQKIDHFDIAFCPERTQEGKALIEVRDIPQIIGGINKNSANRAKKIFKKITKDVLIVSSLETAEMIKLVDNSQRDVYFSYANEIAQICDALNINALEVIEKGKYNYSRTNLAKPGPVGGPCLIKDTYILKESLYGKKYLPNIALAARKINENLPRELIKKIKNKFLEKNNRKVKKIGLLGLAFKGDPPTDDIRDSMSLKFYSEIKKVFPKAVVTVYDKLVKKNDFKIYKIKRAKTLESCFFNSDLILILNNHKIFKQMKLSSLGNKMNAQGIIYDCWNLFDRKKVNLRKDIEYSGFGNSNI
jgi:UDP-N-acetyl-D-mannosaminuronic acid dehydrogenase